MPLSDLSITCLGGGHGLAVTLSSLRSITDHITAVVTVADNGGSSGRLRKEFDVLPPGDIRMALAALCDDSEWGHSWAEILQYRFTSEGELNNHALGNLLLTALWDRDSDAVGGIEKVASLLRLKGKVLPMSLQPLDIVGDFLNSKTQEISRIRGQVEVATSPGVIQAVRLIPDNPSLPPQTKQALLEADWITLGPGSWFSSVMPHLLSPALVEALSQSAAKKIIVFNVREEESDTKKLDEFAGNSIIDHWNFLIRHVPDLEIDYAIIDEGSISTLGLGLQEFENLIAQHGGEVILADVADSQAKNKHSSEKLNSVFASIFSA
jgi:uncharacterized cofD-like protein